MLGGGRHLSVARSIIDASIDPFLCIVHHDYCLVLSETVQSTSMEQLQNNSLHRTTGSVRFAATPLLEAGSMKKLPSDQRQSKSAPASTWSRSAKWSTYSKGRQTPEIFSRSSRQGLKSRNVS